MKKLALMVLILPGCGGSGGGDDGPPIPPVPPVFLVTANVPADTATDVSRTAVIYVTFNRNVNVATLDDSSFFLTDGVTPITGSTIDYNATLRMASLVTPASLAQLTTYTMTMTADIEDTGGLALTPDTFTFTTSNATDATRPVFAGADSATVASTTSIDLDWTLADAGDVTIVYDIYRSTVSGQYNFSAAPTTTTAAGANSITMGSLNAHATYYFVVRARDVDNNTDLNEVEVSATTLASFSLNIWPLVQSNCRTCHTTGDGQDEVPDMEMDTAGNLYNTWINATVTCATSSYTFRVVPSDSANSFLFHKLSTAAPDCGDQMPQTGGMLSPAELQLVQDWIEQGALNN